MKSEIPKSPGLKNSSKEILGKYFPLVSGVTELNGAAVGFYKYSVLQPASRDGEPRRGHFGSVGEKGRLFLVLL